MMCLSGWQQAVVIKNLCMFLPPLMLGEKAAAVIISPLVGLMDEQVLLFYVQPERLSYCCGPGKKITQL